MSLARQPFVKSIPFNTIVTAFTLVHQTSSKEPMQLASIAATSGCELEVCFSEMKISSLHCQRQHQAGASDNPVLNTARGWIEFAHQWLSRDNDLHMC